MRWVNPAWERVLNFSGPELKREELLSFVHPADADDTAAVFDQLRDGDEGIRFENRLRCRDGSYRWLQWSAVPMRHGAIYGIARDITDQKTAAREGEERTRMLVMAEEVAGVGHWRIDLSRDALTWSREMYRIHGLDPATFTPTVEAAVEAYHPDDRGAVSDHIRDAILLRKEFEFELRLVRPDGTVRSVLSRGKCEVSEDGRPLAVFGVFQDVTERKRLQERVAHSERMATVGTLAAGVAHEINNPLTWVIANLDATARELEERTEGGQGEGLEQLNELIAEAQQGADQVRKIVRDLLTYSRSQPECLENVDVEDALDIAVNIATNQFKYRAHLVRDYGHVPPVLADQSRLTQVFVNLIVNAAQAIPERRNQEGEIQLRTSVGGDGRVRIEVVDNGLGIPAEIQARVFDPFYTTKPVGVGTGLGLSITRNIIDSFRGTIEISSTEGSGTCVAVVLPTSPEVADRAASDVSPPMRVLVIDSDGIMGRPISRILSREYDVISLRNGRDALSMINSAEPISAVLCDMEIADMSGVDFFRHVQRIAPELSSRVAFLTGDDFDEAREVLEKAGLPFVGKPIEPGVLREMVERICY